MSKDKDKVVPLRRARKCAVCHKPASQKYYPFCSERCANIDLNRWLSSAYVIPAADDEEEDEHPEQVEIAPKSRD